MLAEGIWYSRGHAPKLIRFCLDGVVFDSREEGVALEDMHKLPMAIHIPLDIMRATPHGYQKFLLVEDDEEDGNLSSVLCLGFHYSNTNKKQIKVKKLFSLGKNVWRDERNNEMFIALSCSSVLEIPFALSVHPLNTIPLTLDRSSAQILPTRLWQMSRCCFDGTIPAKRLPTSL
jgi:hypothetical protein